MEAAESDAVSDLKELPTEMLWLRDTEGISVDEGIKNSGGIEHFIHSLELFYDTVEDSAKVIETAFNEGDVRLYTVKVHALKSSARIIGANELSLLAERLEKAGNDGDLDFIQNNTDELLRKYRSYREKLSKINSGNEASDKEPIPATELADAYSALREVVPMMDYDAVEMILEQLSEYALPEEDALKIKEIEKKLKLLDWDGIEGLLT